VANRKPLWDDLLCLRLQTLIDAKRGTWSASSVVAVSAFGLRDSSREFRELRRPLRFIRLICLICQNDVQQTVFAIDSVSMISSLPISGVQLRPLNQEKALDD
jgi:hypothetical protein